MSFTEKRGPSSVLFVSALNGSGGPCQSLGALLDHIDGFKRVVAISRSDSPTRIDELADELIRIPRPRKFALPVAQVQLFRAALRRRKDIAAIHANGLTELAVAAPAAAALRLPVVVWIHNSEIPAAARLATYVTRLAKVQILWCAVSDQSRQMVHDAKLADAADIVIVPNPIDPSCVGVPQPREKHHLTIGYFAGTDRHVKGFDLLPDCITQLLDEPVRWVIYTSQPFTTNSEAWQKLLALPPERVSVRERVAEVAAAYAATDLVFVPSRRESFCRVAAEAMANGLPVVATDLPALREVLGHDSAGLFFSLENASAAAEQLRVLVNDSKLRSTMGDNGRVRAQAYRPDAVLDSFTKAYESLADRRAHK